MPEAFRQRAARFLKLALPLAGAGVIAAIFAFPRSEFSGVGFDAIAVDLSQGLRLANPRFSGATADGRPFLVTAEWALPDGPDPETVALGPVAGEIRLDDARAVRLGAQGGEIRPKDERLRLEGGVTVETSDGWRLSAAEATVELDDNTLSAAGPVAGEGPSGRIDAGSMRAARTIDGDLIWFEGGVTVRIDPSARGAASEGKP
jgi:lipopolysaccharide export system protein LptC